MRPINLIVIHCADTPNGVYITPAQIDGWHQARGFKREPAAVAKSPTLPHIGYHWVITADGRANTGRATEEVGAHARSHNARSVAICLTGTNRFYRTQWDALQKLLADLAYLWQVDRLAKRDQLPTYPPSPATTLLILNKMGIRVTGHRDLSPDKNGDGKITSIDWLKTCPGFDVAAWLAAGMVPPVASLLDGHPAIASSLPRERIENSNG